jgi:hypothetical protein
MATPTRTASDYFRNSTILGDSVGLTASRLFGDSTGFPSSLLRGSGGLRRNEHVKRTVTILGSRGVSASAGCIMPSTRINRSTGLGVIRTIKRSDTVDVSNDDDFESVFVVSFEMDDSDSGNRTTCLRVTKTEGKSDTLPESFGFGEPAEFDVSMVACTLHK